MLSAKTYTEIMLREIINDLLQQPQLDKERYGNALQHIHAHLPLLDANNPKAFLKDLGLSSDIITQTWKLITHSAAQTLERKLHEDTPPSTHESPTRYLTANSLSPEPGQSPAASAELRVK